MHAQRRINQLLLLSLGLALLGGCGRSRTRDSAFPKATYGQKACGGNFGNFDIQLVQTKDTTQYALYITPISLARVGDLVTITVAGGNNQYRELLSQARLTVGATVQAAILTTEELSRFTTLIIALYEPGVSPLQSRAKLANLCPLVQPGDTVAQN